MAQDIEAVNTIQVSLGASKFDNCPVQCEAASFDEFTDDILVGRGTIKGKTFICAPMAEGYHSKPEKYPGKAAWRQKHLAEPRCYLPLDCDGFDSLETYSMLLGYLKRYQGFAYTTASSMPEAPRCRVVLAQTRVTDRQEGIAACEAVQALIEHELGVGAVKFDQSVYRGEQPLYTPLEGAETFRFTGQPVNVDAMLMLVPAPQSKGKNGNHSRLEQVKSDDKILQAMIKLGMVRSTEDGERFMIECPFAHEHSMDGGDKETMYCLANTHGHPYAAFSCFHGHCTERTQVEFNGAVLARYTKETGKPTPSMPKFGCAVSPAQSPTTFPSPFPGVMADAVTAIMAGANKPQIEMTTLAVTVAMAAGCGYYYALPNDSGLNLYGCAVAESGGGKDIPTMEAMGLANRAGADVRGRMTSGGSLEDLLKDYGGLLMCVGEVAHFFANMTGRNANPNMVDFTGVLLALFTASRSMHQCRNKVGAPGRNVKHPAVSFLGFATPLKLGEALNLGNVEDGLLGRFLFVASERDDKPCRTKKGVELPNSVKSAMLRMDMVKLGFHGAPIVIAIDAAGDKALDALLDEFHTLKLKAKSPAAKVLYTRSYEKAERIAGVLAVYDNEKAPTITTAHIEWARKAVQASNEAILAFMDDYMHSGEVQSHAAQLLRYLKENQFTPTRTSEAEALKAGWVPRSVLLRLAKKMDAKQLRAALDYLLELLTIEATPSDATLACVRLPL
ncbi:DUF3987 domain-containing protein [Pseudomonas sp. Irchel 3A7]|uniref:DUF3987 domain-containing protein n=1 Tax=Pseudomonas sp. Irchel 3A7 TaxID=2008913 RepID=UPI0014827EA9|nr:DUF3987 domain-containing protein [Pseudomonas sp. Irchel 3A7]